MSQNEQEIQEIIEHNKEVKGLFWVWPVVIFILALIIAALAYNFAFVSATA